MDGQLIFGIAGVGKMGEALVRGLIVGRVQGIRFNPDRVYPMLKKIVRGLHYHHSGRFLAPDAEFSWSLDEPSSVFKTIWTLPGVAERGSMLA